MMNVSTAHEADAAGDEMRMVVGVDLVQVSDIARSLDALGERYMRRIWTADEIAYCLASPEMSTARFAADRKSTRLNSSHGKLSRMPSSA